MKFKKILSVILGLTVASSFSMCALACGDDVENWTPPKNTDEYNIPQDYSRTYYELFVRSFSDGNGDGIGDLRGLINNLDYLNDGDDSTMTDLGVNGLWLMPINASPSYHGYDVTNYKTIASDYGTLDDFDELVSECEKRGIWLQMDLVLNHTSSQHPWFKNALKDARDGLDVEDSVWMQRYEFYRKSEKPASGTYYDVSNSDYCYLGNFSSGMPDLNLVDRETNGLKEEIEDIVDFWLERGVRSFRLDAVPWACNNSTNYNEANGEFWTWFNDYCNAKGAEVFGKPDDGINRYCYNVGEVWSSNSQIAPFFSTGMTSFNYDMGGGSNAPFVRVANCTYNAGAATLIKNLAEMQADALLRDPNALLSNFLSNHDNDRSAGYLLYNPSNIKRAAGLYLLAPGNPYIYYGEEIGAEGLRDSTVDSDADRRLPFNWGDSSKGITNNPEGATYTGKQRLGSWKEQTNQKNSILTYYREAIKLRNRFPEIGRGVITAYALDASGKLTVSASAIGSAASLVKANPLNKTIAAYTLEYKGSKILIVQNVGDSAASIDFSLFDGYENVGEVKADGGKAEVNGGKLNISAGVAAIFKIAE